MTRPVPGSEPLISVLIPAYNHPVGVHSAIMSLGPALSRSDVEVLVSDDSNRPQCAAEIAETVRAWGVARYRHNSPPLGAVRNWNSLLGQARGRYCLLLHHDEHFESPRTFDEVLDAIASSAPPDGIVLPCKVVDKSGRKRLHMPVPTVALVMRRFPGYLFRRNVIGAPSVLVLRRDYYEPFDERLKWHVDVELYVRVLTRHHPRLTYFRGRGMLSDAALETSITRSIRGELGAIRREELALLGASGALAGRGSWLLADTPASRLTRAVEWLLWHAFRAVQRACQAAGSRGNAA